VQVDRNSCHVIVNAGACTAMESTPDRHANVESEPTISQPDACHGDRGTTGSRTHLQTSVADVSRHSMSRVDSTDIWSLPLPTACKSES
jgi:hypothetical protein